MEKELQAYGHPSQEEEVNPHRFSFRVPNPSRASIAAAQPLKHVETRKNVDLNSTKTKDFCRICHIENHPHAQKLFVIIVASGIECSVIVLCAHN